MTTRAPTPLPVVSAPPLPPGLAIGPRLPTPAGPIDGDDPSRPGPRPGGLDATMTQMGASGRRASVCAAQVAYGVEGALIQLKPTTRIWEGAGCAGRRLTDCGSEVSSCTETASRRPAETDQVQVQVHRKKANGQHHGSGELCLGGFDHATQAQARTPPTAQLPAGSALDALFPCPSVCLPLHGAISASVSLASLCLSLRVIP